MTNKEFGDAVGITGSYASYIRNGQKLPATKILINIILHFELEPVPAMRAYQEGGEAFGKFLRNTVFDVGMPGTDTETVPTLSTSGV